MSGEQNISRREFLRSLARGAALGALALGGGWLVNRSGRWCFYGNACAACPVYADCSLPERETRVGRGLHAPPSPVAQASQPASEEGEPQAKKPALPGGRSDRG